MRARISNGSSMSEASPSNTLVEATERAFEASPHLRDDRYAGAMAALLALARKIDAWDVIVRMAIEDRDADGKGGRPAVPQNDNVSIASYAKLSEQLGLTPSGQKALQHVTSGNAPAKAKGATAPTTGGTDDGGQADGTGKTAKITALRAGRSVPRPG
jgi:hypothetical protein